MLPSIQPVSGQRFGFSGLPDNTQKLQLRFRDQPSELMLTRNGEVVRDAQGDGLLNAVPVCLQSLAEPGAGVRFHGARRGVFGLDDDRETAGMANDDIGP